MRWGEVEEPEVVRVVAPVAVEAVDRGGRDLLLPDQAAIVFARAAGTARCTRSACHAIGKSARNVAPR
jgi:hypothetical protein